MMKTQAMRPMPGRRSRSVLAALGVALALGGCSAYEDDLAAAPEVAVVAPAQDGLIGETSRPSYVEGVARRRPVPLTAIEPAPPPPPTPAPAQVVERGEMPYTPSPAQVPPPPQPLIAAAQPPIAPVPVPVPVPVAPSAQAAPILQAQGAIPVAPSRTFSVPGADSERAFIPPTAPPRPIAEAQALMRVPPLKPPSSTAAPGMLVVPTAGGAPYAPMAVHDPVDELGTVVIDAGGVQFEQFVPGAAAPPPALPPYQADGSAVQVFDEPDAPLPIEPFDRAGTQTATLAATIQFGVGSAELSAKDREVLRKVAELYKQFGGKIRVVGHASSRTADMPWPRHKTVNLQVSAARAQAVARTLGRYSIPNEVMYVGAVGDNDPLYYEVMPAGEAGNRRTEIYFEY